MIWIGVLIFLAGVLTGSLVFGDWDDEPQIGSKSSILAAMERKERENNAVRRCTEGVAGREDGQATRNIPRNVRATR